MRNILIISILAIFLCIVGCEGTPEKNQTSTPAASVADATPNPTPMTESSEPGVHRMLSKIVVPAGEEFEYTLKMIPNSEISYWVFNDGFPSEVKYISNDAGTFNSVSSEFKEVELSNMSVRKFNVIAKAPETPGKYMWTGQYFFEGDKDGEEITGDSYIIVK